MFGEISVMAWLGAAIMLAIGGGAGFFVARQIKDKRTLELEQQLEATRTKLNDYQEDVNRHFLKTSLLFSKLTDNYRDVYEHLATGAQKLCNDKPHISALDLPDTKILSAAVAQTAIPTDEKPAAEAANPTSTEAAQDDAAHLGAESISASENTAAKTTETATADDANESEQIMADQSVAEPSVTETTAAETAGTENANAEAEPTDDRPTISAAELKTLEANEKKKSEEEDVHLGAESTPGVELEHHKTHPSIH